MRNCLAPEESFEIKIEVIDLFYTSATGRKNGGFNIIDGSYGKSIFYDLAVYFTDITCDERTILYVVKEHEARGKKALR